MWKRKENVAERGSDLDLKHILKKKDDPRIQE